MNKSKIQDPKSKTNPKSKTPNIFWIFPPPRRWRTRLVVVAGICGFWISGAAFAAAIPPQTLSKGESLTLSTDYEIGDTAITDPNVVDFVVRESRIQVYLNAKKEGFATLTLWDKEGHPRDVVPITVFASSLKDVLSDAKRSFHFVPSVQFLVEGDSVRMVGEVPSANVYKKMEAFAKAHPEVTNEVTIAEPVLETMTDQIEKAIGIPGIKVRSVRNQIIVEGVVYSEAQANKAYEIAKLYDPNALNLMEVRKTDRVAGKEKMVQLDFFFMEIQKSALKTFGIQWAPGSFPKSESANGFLGGSGGEGVAGLGQSLIGFVLNLIPKIRFINEKGLGRVLENPTLFVKSGDHANFFSGVQVPYFAKDSVEFKEVGVKIEAEPIVSGNDVDLKLNATLSSPSPHIQGGINTHTVSTTAYIPSDHAVVLGGILSNRDVKTYNRVPHDLATSSALFTLFLSKDFQTSKSELVVFVLPRIVNQPADAAFAQKEWEGLEEQITEDRSMKEYLEYMKKKGKEPKKKRR